MTSFLMDPELPNQREWRFVVAPDEVWFEVHEGFEFTESRLNIADRV